MKKAIVLGYDLHDAEQLYKTWCNSNNIPCRLNEAVLLSSKLSMSYKQEKIRGYYSEVMNDKIKLIGLDKQYFHYLYNYF